MRFRKEKFDPKTKKLNILKNQQNFETTKLDKFIKIILLKMIIIIIIFLKKHWLLTHTFKDGTSIDSN